MFNSSLPGSYIQLGVVCIACRFEKYISSSWINFNTIHLTIIAQSHDEILSLTRSIAHIFSNVWSHWFTFWYALQVSITALNNQPAFFVNCRFRRVFGGVGGLRFTGVDHGVYNNHIRYGRYHQVDHNFIIPFHS